MSNKLNLFIFLILLTFCLTLGAYADINVVGKYDTDWGELNIVRQTKTGDGYYVQGAFTDKSYECNGMLRGRTLRDGRWFKFRGGPKEKGTFECVFSSDGSSFRGRWKYKGSSSWDGEITGVRMGSSGGPGKAAKKFFKAVARQDRGGIWNTLTETSRQSLTVYLAKKTNVSVSKMRNWMNQPNSEISRGFWKGFGGGKTFRKFYNEGKFGKARISGSRAYVPFSVRGKTIDLKMYKEGGSWKLGWIETFPMGDSGSGVLKKDTSLKVSPRVRVTFKGGTKVKKHKSGYVATGTLARTTSLKISPNVRLSLKRGTRVKFHSNSILAYGTLSRNTTLRLNPDQAITFKRGSKIVFDYNGSLHYGVLTHPITIYGKRYPAGARVNFLGR